jgi:sigma-B regulation protein RsbU (phosphoserine phosphatase)
MMAAPKTPQPSGERLELLYRLSQAFNSTLDLDEVLNRVMDEVITTMHAERGFVMLVDPDGKTTFRAARGLEQKTLEDPQFQVSRSVVEKVLHEGEPILTSDAMSDERFNMRKSIMAMGLRAILCVPLKNKDTILGVIYVDNRLRAGIFQRDDLSLLASIADSAAIAIENARLYRLAIEQGRLERELQMARKVQSSLLPHELPQLPGWQFAARWQPAREVGGDYYDFIPLHDQQLGVLIADVTDKGMPAALFMAATRNFVRTSADGAGSPADCITRVNRLLHAESNDDMYASMFYALLDPVTGELTYVNAGHNPPLHLPARADKAIELERTGMWLGVDENSKFEQRAITLQHGDLLLLYTDGVTDALNAAGEEYGLERVREVMYQQCAASSEAISEALIQSLAAFTAGSAPFDDITLVLIKRQ